MSDAPQPLLVQRDTKVKPHLVQYAPVWLVDEKIIAADDAVQFDVVFRHHQYGWVRRRYRFDAFNSVLYHKGQTTLSDDDVLAIEARDPYIAALVADIPNSYGG